MIKANKKLADEWFRIAESDLKFAQVSFRDFAAFYPQICFLCQQSAEKYLKGFLVFHRKRFLKIHDLVELTEQCAEIDKEFLKLKEGMAKLSQYYIIVRYPLEYYPAGKNDAQSAIGFAEEIRQFIYAKII